MVAVGFVRGSGRLAGLFHFHSPTVSALLGSYVLVRRAYAQICPGPTISRLTLKPRMTVNDHMRAGRYGRLHRVGRVVYADLAEVSRAEGATYSERQLDLASAGLPDRILTIREPKEAADGRAET